MGNLHARAGIAYLTYLTKNEKHKDEFYQLFKG